MSNTKICDRCGVEKELESFARQGRSPVCKHCKEKAVEEKKERYRSSTMNVDDLDSSLEEITVIKQNTKFAYTVSYDEAVHMVNDNEATVISNNTIYKLLLDKKFILKKANYKCYYCGQYGDTIDHIVPIAKGGTNSYNNLVCACYKCNQEKRDADVKIFKQQRFEEMIDSLNNKPRW